MMKAAPIQALSGATTNESVSGETGSSVAAPAYERREQPLPFVGRERRLTKPAQTEENKFSAQPPAPAHEAGVPPFSATSNPSNRFKRIAKEHSLWNHPLVERCRSGALTLPEVRVLGAQMYKFSFEFSRFLAKALAVCPHEDARVVISENLWDELGKGEPGQTHPALFRRFTRALGIDDLSLEATPAEPETAELIDTYLGLADRLGVLGVLGAICYASEGIVAALYSHIEKGLLGTIPFEKDALVFFDLHIRVDDGHANKLESVVIPLLRTLDDINQVEAAIEVALDARCRFFDGVLRAAERDGSCETVLAAAA